MSLPNEMMYLNFAGFIGKQQDTNKELRQKISKNCSKWKLKYSKFRI